MYHVIISQTKSYNGADENNCEQDNREDKKLIEFIKPNTIHFICDTWILMLQTLISSKNEGSA